MQPSEYVRCIFVPSHLMYTCIYAEMFLRKSDQQPVLDLTATNEACLLQQMLITF